MWQCVIISRPIPVSLSYRFPTTTEMQLSMHGMGFCRQIKLIEMQHDSYRAEKQPHIISKHTYLHIHMLYTNNNVGMYEYVPHISIKY